MDNKMKSAIKNRSGWLSGNLLLLAASCATEPHLAVAPVGPAPSAGSHQGHALFGTGSLEVYSATETRHVGQLTQYYPHTDYVIYGSDGKFFTWVKNAAGNTDETPAVVRLPAGSYTVQAEDDDYGRVRVPVVIENGQTTAVYLEPNWSPLINQKDTGNFVRLPNGWIVGWRAADASPPTTR